MLRNKLPSPNRFYLNRSGVFALVLLGFVALSLIAIIQLQHHIRHLETQYAQSLKKEVSLKEEWGKLKLEKHHLTALARVEELARQQLGMTLEKSPKQNNAQTIYLAPETERDE